MARCPFSPGCDGSHPSLAKKAGRSEGSLMMGGRKTGRMPTVGTSCKQFTSADAATVRHDACIVVHQAELRVSPVVGRASAMSLAESVPGADPVILSVSSFMK